MLKGRSYRFILEAPVHDSTTLQSRRRSCGFAGHAEYDTIRDVKRATRLPVIANGDIATPDEAKRVLDYTGADGVMIGRAAQGAPWIFREIEHYLATGRRPAPPTAGEIREVLVVHLAELYQFYGRETGVKVARKHIAWYTRGLEGSAELRAAVNRAESDEEQLAEVERFFRQIGRQETILRDNKEEMAA